MFSLLLLLIVSFEKGVTNSRGSSDYKAAAFEEVAAFKLPWPASSALILHLCCRRRLPLSERVNEIYHRSYGKLTPQTGFSPTPAVFFGESYHLRPAVMDSLRGALIVW